MRKLFFSIWPFMLTIEAGNDGLPIAIAKLQGVAVYLDNWAIIELGNGDATRRKRFVDSLKSCGSLLFSFTNSIELGEAEGAPANRIRTFLDEIGNHWIPIELNPFKVRDRENEEQGGASPCVSTVFLETFMKDRLHELSPEGTKVVDLSPEALFKLTSVMTWSNESKLGTRAGAEAIDTAVITMVGQEHEEWKKDPKRLDEIWPPLRYSAQMAGTFALHHLLRLLVTELKQRALKRGDGRDLCHSALGAAYGSIAALDKHWKRRVEALPHPNNLARIYYGPELDEMVNVLEAAAAVAAARRGAAPTSS